jgi:hypothetical protein
MKEFNNYSFLAIGKTQESTETAEGFKKYIGLASTYVLAVNPDKHKMEELLGHELKEDPKYLIKNEETGKVEEARVTFIVRTDPNTNNGIEITNLLVFPIKMTPEYNRDETTMRVIDKYGNSVRANAEDAKAGKALASNMKIDQNNYRIAYSGEADLVAFLKQYLCVPSALNYVNGAWGLNDKTQDGLFELEKIKDYFNGDFSEIRKAIEIQPNNKVKLLYGVRTAETENGTRQYQTISTKGDFILRNNAGDNAKAKLDADLKKFKDAGGYPNTEFEVCDLKEWTVEPTNLDAPSAASAASDSANKMPWD